MKRLINFKKSLIFSNFLFLASACTSISRNTLVEEITPKPTNCPIHFYRTVADVPVPYTAVCDLNSRVLNLPWNEAKSGEALENSRQMICDCGADAILIGSWAKHALFLQGNLRIVAIRYQKRGAPEIGQPMSFDTILNEYRCDDEGGTWHEAKCKLPEGKNQTFRPERK